MLIGRIIILLVSVAAGTLVTIKQGTLQGHYFISRKGREFLAFQGIPYATPPLGPLRFRAPLPATPWEGVLNATQYASLCTQRSVFAKQEEVVGNEDCLYLNVFTPKVNGNLDVMVWFHGGGFVSGTAAFYDPHNILDHDVVLVTVNYRLGPLGFLSTGDREAPGNFGLKDQVAALKWVQANIDAFGGNPQRVTLFGESAGGSSVHFHMISPLSHGLFQRGISQSGTVLCSWAVAPNGTSTHQAKKMAKLLDCPLSPSADLVNCLRTKEATDIIATDRQFMEWHVDPIIPFKVVVEPADIEDAFLPEDPLELLQKAPDNIPWLTGINSGDGALKAAPIYEKPELVLDLDKQFEYVAPISLFYKDTSSPNMLAEISQRIRKFYFKEQPIGNNTLHEVVNMYTDSFFLSAADEAVRVQLARNKKNSNSAPIYYYYFTYRGHHSFSELFGDPTRDFGVCHADELIYLFPSQRVFANYTPSKEEEEMADVLISMWTNFAHTGDPTPTHSWKGAAWLPVRSTDELEYLHIGSPNEIYMKRGLLTQRAQFWNSLPLKRKYLIRDEL
ncbi:Venom carboxylesterase-6 [Blattella germanica]|nr:Venom carboxylesterase-6 [Blattella germanica]